MITENGHWSDKYNTPENKCVNCDHARNSHIGEAPLRGMSKESDSGWCHLAARDVHTPSMRLQGVR